MIATLILLYALDTGQIPDGCFIAAWICSGINFAASILKFIVNISSNERNKY